MNKNEMNRLRIVVCVCVGGRESEEEEENCFQKCGDSSLWLELRVRPEDE